MRDQWIKRVCFRNYKALKSFALELGDLTVLTGLNNAGKSTALSAFRLLDAAVGIAHRLKPVLRPTHHGRRHCYLVPTENLAVSIANIHTDLQHVDTDVTFELSSGEKWVLYFPKEGGCYFYVLEGAVPKSPTQFRRQFPFSLIQVPVLGPLEDNEKVVKKDTIRKGLGTHRASRHFRNYWINHPDEFSAFAKKISETWPGIVMEPPEYAYYEGDSVLHMFCQEYGRTRELYWCGFGFQIWCQLLTHISRASDDTILMMDEPETYLHPRVQQQLLGIVRQNGAQVIMATHSATMIATAQEGEVVAISREHRQSMRYTETGTRLCEQLGLLPSIKGS